MTQRNLIGLTGLAHSLTAITTLVILFGIPEPRRPKVAIAEDLECYPSIKKMAPERFIMGKSQNIKHFFLSYTSMNNEVDSSVKEISLNPGI